MRDGRRAGGWLPHGPVPDRSAASNFCGGVVRLTDHPNPQVHSGYSFWPNEARVLAEALISRTSTSVNTLEGRVLHVRPSNSGLVIHDHVTALGAWRVRLEQARRLGEALLQLIHIT